MVFKAILYVSCAALIVAPMVTFLCCVVAFGVRRRLTERARREDMKAVANAAREARTAGRKITPRLADEPDTDDAVTMLSGPGDGVRAPAGPPRKPAAVTLAAGVINGQSAPDDPTETAQFAVGDLNWGEPTGEHAPGGGRTPAAQYVRLTDGRTLAPVEVVVGDGR